MEYQSTAKFSRARNLETELVMRKYVLGFQWHFAVKLPLKIFQLESYTPSKESGYDAILRQEHN